MEHKLDTMLVTIVADRGSAPRTAGAGMLVGPGGRLVGTIGGGAVEKRAEEMAVEAIKEKKSLVHDFELRYGSGDGLGMVCGGNVTVLFNIVPWDSGEWKQVISAALKLMDEHKKYWFINPVEGGVPTVVSGGAVIAGPDIPGKVLSELNGEKPLLIGGEYFAEHVNCGERLVIFGAGHIAKCLCPLARTVGFRPVIYDDRPQYANKENFPEAEDIICADFGETAKHIEITEDDYIVIMTSGHASDYSVQSRIMLGGKYAYLGVIGSRAKTLALNKKLTDIGITAEALSLVHTPIGLKIGAVTPEEIAVSIAGELILVRAEKMHNS